MTRAELLEQIFTKKSMLCVGLDSDPAKIPAHLHKFEDPVFEFNKAIIDATHKYTVAYKPNIAFYEALGIKGWESLQKTIDYLNKYYPECFTIADAKRGDIGNTSSRYAKAFFENLQFDSITVAPYMGRDSVKPFLEFDRKWVILLALTSNPGAEDFQFMKENTDNEPFLFEKVLEISKEWGSTENLMYVVGATRAEMLLKIRKIIPDHFLLIPGVGAQGGDLEEVIKNGITNDPALLINSARGIIYKSDKEDFAEKAAEEAQCLQLIMQSFLS